MQRRIVLLGALSLAALLLQTLCQPFVSQLVNGAQTALLASQVRSHSGLAVAVLASMLFCVFGWCRAVVSLRLRLPALLLMHRLHWLRL